MLNKTNTEIQNTDVEWRILGALLEPKNVDWVNRISPAIFTEHREDVFRAIQLTFVDYGVISFEGINKHLKGTIPGELFASQGAEIRSAVDEGIRLARKRQLLERSLLLKELSQDFDPSEDKVRQLLEMPPIMAEKDSSVQTGASVFLGNLHAKVSGEYNFADTGIPFLNARLGGEWKPQALIGILGNHGSGKTALVANSMLRMSELDNPIASLFFSLEMSKADLVNRWIADMLSIDAGRILKGNVTEEELRAIETATIDIQQREMYVIDNPEITLPEIIFEIRKHVHRYGVRVVFIDYLQILNYYTGNRNADLGHISKLLKNLAKRENITIVMLSQVTPGNEGTNRIRDSGEVGAVMDAMAELFLEDDTGPVRNMIMQWHKNRFGGLGKAAIQFIGMYYRFEAAVAD